MARESRRKRDERRFGRPERLADMLTGTPVKDWVVPSEVGPAHAGQVARLGEMFRESIGRAALVVADNVGEYYYTTPKNRFDYTADFPCVMPPFRRLFVEMARPSRIVCEDKTYSWPAHYPRRYGCLVECGPIDGIGLFSLRGMDRYLEIASERGEPHSFVMQAGFVSIDGSRPYFDFVGQWLILDRSGSVLAFPWPMLPPFRSETSHLEVMDQWFPLFQSVTLTLSFLNCKNVTLDAHDPDRAINRERRRAGLKPFVRYHTINIEPMKRVLKSEGSVEQHGLKKALHICRGHFATYTDRMFGRELETPVTVWRPAHVRGSAKEGIVVSDYRVNAPRGGHQ